MFINEAKKLLEMKHDQIPKLMGYFISSEVHQHVLVMDFVDGDNFQSLVKTKVTNFPRHSQMVSYL